jgi:hypothetical protein
MKQKIVPPLIDEMTKSQQPKESVSAPPKPPPQAPPQPAELDQDPGGGYNPDHTIPQT